MKHFITRILLSFAPLALVAFVFFVLPRLGLKRPGTRREAARLGLDPTDVTRTVALIVQGGSWKLGDAKCVAYRLPVARLPGSIQWALLMRPDANDPGYPEGWTIRAAGPMPPRLSRELQAISREWSNGEFLEFESDVHGHVAYWTEWGGAEKAQQIEAYLRRIAVAESEQKAGTVS